MILKKKMKSTSKYEGTTYGMIGISVDSDSLEAIEEVQTDKYALFDIKRLTKANSFMILDEVFYIAKKDPSGKPSPRLYHVYRMSDKMYVCPSTKSKEETIAMVIKKY